MSILFVSFRTYFDDSNHMKLGIDLGIQGQGRGQEGGVISTGGSRGGVQFLGSGDCFDAPITYILCFSG